MAHTDIKLFATKIPPAEWEAFAGDAPEVVGEEYAFLKRAAQKVTKKEDDSGTLL